MRQLRLSQVISIIILTEAVTAVTAAPAVMAKEMPQVVTVAPVVMAAGAARKHQQQ